MRALAAWLLLALAGCNPYDDLRLLDVTAVEPPQIEPGGVLRIEGSGFPLGLDPTVSLDGTLFRPGSSPESFQTVFPAKVQTESRIVAPVPDEVVESFDGRGTFDGVLRLAFRTANGRRDVYADRNVVVDFLPDTTLMLRGDADGSALPSVDAEHFGMVLSREETGAVGVRVEAVTPGAPADAQGVRVGDVIVGLDGLRVYSWRDFLPDPSRTESRVSVVREGLAGVHALRWPHDATMPQASLVALAVMLLLGLALGWRSPAVLCIRAASAGSVAGWLTRASCLLVLSAALVCVGALETTTAWIVGLGLFAALQAFASRTRTVAVDYALAIVSTLTIMLLAQTASLSSIAMEQAGSVLDWYAFRSPASTLAFAAFIAALGRAADLERLSSTLYASAGALLGAALFLGGRGAGAPEEAIPVLFAKAVVLLLGSRWFALDRRTAVTMACAGLFIAFVQGSIGFAGLAPFWAPASLGTTIALLVRAAAPPFHRPATPTIA